MTIKKYLCTLSGDDYGIIEQCGQNLQNRFAMIGMFVLFIFCLCFASSYFTFIKLFPYSLVGIPIALFFAWMITNIYLLLLYTLSKNVLPHKGDKKTKILSIVVRIIFICFIAAVVSKPLEALLFSAPLGEEIAQYKNEKINKYNAITNEFFDGESDQIKLMIEKRKKLNEGSENVEIEKYRQNLIKKENQKNELISKMSNLVQNSNYYVRSIGILNSKYPACWLITLLIASIFLTPAVLKNFVSEKSNYYDLKRRIEVGLIRQEYFQFKTKYRQIFQDRFNEEKTYSELYADAPFNTLRINDRTEFLTESDLISELYDG